MSSEQRPQIGLGQLVREYILPYNTLFSLSGVMAVVLGMISPYLVIGLGLLLIACFTTFFLLDALKRQHVSAWVHSSAPSVATRTAKFLWHAPGASARDSGMFWAVLIVGLAVTVFGLKSVRDAQHAAAAQLGAGVPSIERDPSVAVLPFVSIGGEKEQEYFAEGLSEELLDLLAKVPKLRVSARTSSFAFAGKGLAVDAIAQKLHVASLLEGSIGRAGDTLRVRVRLVRGTDGAQLWSDSFERPMADVFKVQDEIAAAVVSKMKVSLMHASPTAKTIDTRAYPIILHADELARQRSVEGTNRALELYTQALTIAPDEPRAMVGRAVVYRYQADTAMRPAAEGNELARNELTQALAADPRNVGAHVQMALVALTYDRDAATAAKHLESALAAEPTNAAALRVSVTLLLSLGRLDAATPIAEYVAARDPANVSTYILMMRLHAYADRWEAAAADAKSALDLSPRANFVRGYLGTFLAHTGDLAGAMREATAEPTEAGRLLSLATVHRIAGRQADAQAALQLAGDKYGKLAPFTIAESWAQMGQNDEAFRWLDTAIAVRDTSLIYSAASTRLRGLAKDPRWPLFLQKIGGAPEQMAAIKFKVHLPTSK
jgi:TolB-like protein